MLIPKGQRIAFAFLALVLIVGVGVAAALSFATPQNDPCAEYSKKTEAEAHNGCVESAATQSIAEYTELLAYFTVILALGTFGLGAIGYWQGSVARDEFNATQRPKIKILTVETGYYDLPAERDEEGLLREKVGVEVVIRFVNFGTSDAITQEIGTAILQEEPVGEIEYRKLDTKLVRLVSGEEGTHRNDSFGHKEIFDGMFGENFYCVGYIRYKDIAGRYRKTAFLWEYADGNWRRVKDSPYDHAY